MLTSKRSILGAFTLVFATLLVAGTTYADDRFTSGRNLPVDVDYRHDGDRKYDERLYPQTGGATIAAAALDQVLPSRNLPVDNDFHNHGDRPYSRVDVPELYQSSAGAPLFNGSVHSDRNMPVSNNYHNHGDRKYDRWG